LSKKGIQKVLFGTPGMSGRISDGTIGLGGRGGRDGDKSRNDSDTCGAQQSEIEGHGERAEKTKRSVTRKRTHLEVRGYEQ